MNARIQESEVEDRKQQRWMKSRENVDKSKQKKQSAISLEQMTTGAVMTGCERQVVMAMVWGACTFQGSRCARTVVVVEAIGCRLIVIVVTIRHDEYGYLQ